MTRLRQLFDEQGQSPWLDNLTRPYLRDGILVRMVADGIRGVTANPTIFAKAIEGSNAYDEQFASLIHQGRAVSDAYWDLVVDDVRAALKLLRPVFNACGGTDGFVSIEVAPELARDTQATVVAARDLHQRIDQPNLFVKIPATAEGVAAIQEMTAEGRNINVTLIFSLARYAEVIEAYLSGLEQLAARDGDVGSVRSVASFFVSRVDTEVDRRLDAIGTPDTRGLRGQAAVVQAKLAYRLFGERFGDHRWQQLASQGAAVQRPLWASTSTKNPALPDTLYVDGLIGSDTVTTLPETTIAAFEDHGTVACTVDRGVEEADGVMRRLAESGVDMDDVGATLENQGGEPPLQLLAPVMGVVAATGERPHVGDAPHAGVVEQRRERLGVDRAVSHRVQGHPRPLLLRASRPPYRRHLREHARVSTGLQPGRSRDASQPWSEQRPDHG